MLEPDDRIALLYSQAEQQAEAVFKPTIPIDRFFRNIYILDNLFGYSGTFMNWIIEFKIDNRLIIKFITLNAHLSYFLGPIKKSNLSVQK